MLLLIAATVLFLTACLLPVIRLARPAFNYYWLVCAAGAFAAWAIAIASFLVLPQQVQLPVTPLAFTADEISWSFTAGLATLALAILLTAVARLQQPDWQSWMGSLLVVSLGMFAVLSGTPLALAAAWTTLDMVELGILLLKVPGSSERQRVIRGLLPRLTGILALVWAIALMGPGGTASGFDSLPQSSRLLMVIAAGARLGVLPLHTAYLLELPVRRGLGAALRLTPAAAALVLLVRTADPEAGLAYANLILLLTGLASLFGSWAWATTASEVHGRPFWIMGMSGLAVAAAVKGIPAASFAWSLACLFAGGLIFLVSSKNPVVYVTAALGAACITALPFTPAWLGSELYMVEMPGGGSPLTAQTIFDHLFALLYILSQALLLAGFVRHLLAPGDSLAGVERWVRVVYPVGLFLLPAVFIFIGIRSLPDIENVSLAGWAGGASACLLAALLWAYSLRGPRLPTFLVDFLRRLFSLSWLYGLLWAVYSSLGRLVSLITRTLEGEGGVLWALVLLALLFTLIMQSSGG